MVGLISYLGGTNDSGSIDLDDMVAYLSNNMTTKIMALNGFKHTEAFLSLEQAKLSQEDLIKILSSVQDIYKDMPEKLGNISHLWNGNRRKRPEFGLEIAQNMVNLYGINVRKVRTYTEEEKKNGNTSSVQFIGEELVLPDDRDSYDMAPLSLHDDILNVIFEKHGKTLIDSIIGKRDYSVFGDKAAEAEKIVYDSFEDAFKKQLPEVFARSLRTAYKNHYQTYDAVSEYSKNYDALFAEVKSSIDRKNFDFDKIDDLYIAASAFNAGLPEQKTPLALLQQVALDKSIDAKDRAQAVYRLTKYSTSFNRNLFAIPAERFLNEHPEVLNDLELPDKEFGLIEYPAGSGNFVLDSRLLEIRRILSLNPPYVSCVAIWDAANDFRAKNKDASLEKLIPFTQEASLKFETWSDDPNKSLSNLNGFISKSLKDLDKWDALNVRIQNKFVSEGLPEDQPVALAIKKYIAEAALNPENRNDTITLINLDNLSDRLIWALKGEEYIQGAYYSPAKEAELLTILSQIEDLHNKPDENGVLKIDAEELPSHFFLKNASRTTEEEANQVAAILQDIADFVNETPLEDLPHLKKGAFGFAETEDNKINPQKYTYQAPQNIQVIKEKGLYFVSCEIAGYTMNFTKDSVETLYREGKGAMPPFGAFMTAMLLQQQEGNTKVTVFTSSQDFLYMAAMAAAMHGITVEPNDKDKITLSAEQKAAVEQVLEEYRRKNPNYMADFKANSPRYAHENKKPKDIDELKEKTKEEYNYGFEFMYNKAEISTYGEKRETFLADLEKDAETFDEALTALTDKMPDIRNFTLLKDEIIKAGGGEEDFRKTVQRIQDGEMTNEDHKVLGLASLDPANLTEEAYKNYQEGLEILEKAFQKSSVSESKKELLRNEFTHQTIEPEALLQLTVMALHADKKDLKTEKDIPNVQIPKESQTEEYQQYLDNQKEYLEKLFEQPEIAAYADTVDQMRSLLEDYKEEELPKAYINAIKSVQRMRKGDLSEEQYVALFFRDCYGSLVFDLSADTATTGELVTTSDLSASAYDIYDGMFVLSLFAEGVEKKLEDFPEGEEKDKLQNLFNSTAEDYKAGVVKFFEDYAADPKALTDALAEKGVSEDIIKEINEGKISGFSLDTCVKALQKDTLFSMSMFMEEHEAMKKDAVLTLYEKNKEDITNIKSSDMPEEAKRGLLLAYMAAANEIAENGDLYNVPTAELPDLMDSKVSEILVKTLGEDIRGRKITIAEFNEMKARNNAKGNDYGKIITERFNNNYR